MQSYFSIISVAIRPEIQEKISIGMLLIGEGGAYLEFSKTKLNIAKQLLDNQFYTSLTNEVKSVQNAFCKIDAFNPEIPFGEDYLNQLFGKEYLSYLNRYKNNGLIFEKPTKIDIRSNRAHFNQLYSQFVDEASFALENTTLKETFQSFKRETLPKFKPYFNLNYQVNSAQFTDLLVPLRFDLVGKNEIEVFGKSIDLERRSYYIKNDLSNLLFLKDALPYSKRFIISKEPDRQFIQQHMIWKNLRAANWLEYVDVGETERIEEYAKEHDVKPLFEDTH